MIKIPHSSKQVRQVLHELIAAITREKVAHILKRIGEPFIQHLLVLIVSALLALSLGCTLFAPRPIAMTHTRANLLSIYQPTLDYSSAGQQGRKGTQHQ